MPLVRSRRAEALAKLVPHISNNRLRFTAKAVLLTEPIRYHFHLEPTDH